MTAEDKPSKKQLRAAELDTMTCVLTPYYKTRMDQKPGETDYPYIAPHLRYVSEYAKQRQWDILLRAGFRSRKDVYEKALERIAEDWAKASMGALRVQMIEENIPQRPDLTYISAEWQVQQETAELDDRSKHVLSVLQGASESYHFYPLKRGERKPTGAPIGIAYNAMRLMHGD